MAALSYERNEAQKPSTRMVRVAGTATALPQPLGATRPFNCTSSRGSVQTVFPALIGLASSPPADGQHNFLLFCSSPPQSLSSLSS